MPSIDDRMLSFSQGLAGVRRAQDLAPLPNDILTPAVDTQPKLHLDALYDQPGLDDALMASTVPDLADPGLLEPTAFADALEDAHRALTRLADGRLGPDAVFAEALAVLDDARGNRLILEAARRALTRG